MSPTFSGPGTGAPSPAELNQALAAFILSASGWRKVVALSGGEEDPDPGLGPADSLLFQGAADLFVTFLQERHPDRPLRVALGRDSRPTGSAVANALLRVLLARGVEVDDLGVVAAPELMAWVQTGGLHQGFLYVSASHNPVGHNGLKLGLGTGGVVGGADAAELIARFRAGAADPVQTARWQRLGLEAPAAALELCRQATAGARDRAAAAYTALSDEILTLSSDLALRAQRLHDLGRLVRGTGLGVVAELNGSARGLSIDRVWLEGLGVKVRALNTQPGVFVHRIVPEGSSLDLCRRELERAHAEDPDFLLGYVPDCDGDRGNVVIFDAAQGRARALEAQEVFALCVLSELAGLDYFGEGGPRSAVVCNDPTSFRIDAVASAFGARVFRAEVGEANVVNRARGLRAEGWNVRLLGEGSNGGNITHPGSVRDPLSTLGSLIKLVCLRSAGGRPGLFERWCRASGQDGLYRDDYSLADVVASLPAWTTTGSSEDRAMLRLAVADHGALKARFEALWPVAFAERLPELRRRWGITGWHELNYEGTAERAGTGSEVRSGRQTGGLKVVLTDANGAAAAALWLRGSGTEPVFRVLAEVRGQDPEGEADLLAWLTTLVTGSLAQTGPR